MTEEITAEELAEIAARADAATAGPWWAEYFLDDLSWREGHHAVLAREGDPIRVSAPDWETPEEQTRADAEFIAAARTDIPRLIAALRAATAETVPEVTSEDQGPPERR